MVTEDGGKDILKNEVCPEPSVHEWFSLSYITGKYESRN